jgi:hypothetical protein
MGLGELRRVLTRDVRQLVAQKPRGSDDPGQLVPGQKSHAEAWDWQDERPGVQPQKGSTRRCQLDAASATLQELGTCLLLKVSNLPNQRRLRAGERSCRATDRSAELKVYAILDDKRRVVMDD